MLHSVKDKIWVTAILCLLAKAPAASGLSDNQIWSSITVYKEMPWKIILYAGPQAKWSENAKGHYLTRYDVGAGYAGNESVRPRLGFKRILKKDVQTMQETDIFYFDLILKRNWEWVAVDVRNRGELRFEKAGPNVVRARQRCRMA